MQADHNSPSQVIHHKTIFILPRAIIGMQMNMRLATTMSVEEMMLYRNDGVCPFPTLNASSIR